MNNILNLLNDLLVLKSYKAQDTLEVWDQLEEEVRDNLEYAKELVELASDFQGGFKELREMGVLGFISTTNIRVYIGEIIDNIENESENEND